MYGSVALYLRTSLMVSSLVTAACWFIGAVHGDDGRGNGYVLVVITVCLLSPNSSSTKSDFCS